MIVDDEPLARLRLEDLLKEEQDVDLVGTFGDSTCALDSIRAVRPDVVFLDVQMPRMSGIELLAALRATMDESRRPYVVLVTAFDDYALEAFEYEALDYVVKPFENARFHGSLRRARQRISERNDAGLAVALNSERVRLGDGSAPLWSVPESILWVESAGHLVLVHMRRRTAHVRAAISEVEEQLAPHGFLRVHRSALVNSKSIETLQLAGGKHTLRLLDGTCVPVSRRRIGRIRALLG